jgi:hypothetical protein
MIARMIVTGLLALYLSSATSLYSAGKTPTPRTTPAHIQQPQPPHPSKSLRIFYRGRFFDGADVEKRVDRLVRQNRHTHNFRGERLRSLRLADIIDVRCGKRFRQLFYVMLSVRLGLLTFSKLFIIVQRHYNATLCQRAGARAGR